MRARSGVVAVATLGLGVLLAARHPPREMVHRLQTLTRFAPRELATRRLGGSSAAFDRGFDRFVESARRTLPADCAGVALYVPSPSPQYLYLASYVLAPVPVRLAPAALPPGWIAAVYGAGPPPGLMVLRRLPGGALAGPAPRPL